jgi:hypothetical protein
MDDLDLNPDLYLFGAMFLQLYVIHVPCFVLTDSSLVPPITITYA